MSRFLIAFLFGAVFMNSACEKCKRCEYTYTVTTIVSTPNGEEEVVETKTGFVLDSAGGNWAQECIKNKEEFSIVDAYEAESAVSTLDDFAYECEDF